MWKKGTDQSNGTRNDHKDEDELSRFESAREPFIQDDFHIQVLWDMVNRDMTTRQQMMEMKSDSHDKIIMPTSESQAILGKSNCGLAQLPDSVINKFCDSTIASKNRIQQVLFRIQERLEKYALNPSVIPRQLDPEIESYFPADIQQNRQNIFNLLIQRVETEKERNTNVISGFAKFMRHDTKHPGSYLRGVSYNGNTWKVQIQLFKKQIYICTVET